jgi:hypothetical protein
MQQTVDEGFLSEPQLAAVEVGTDPVEMLLRLSRSAPRRTGDFDAV